MRLVLLHSPLVGPGTWRHLTPALEARGHDVVAPDLTAAMRGNGPYYPALLDIVHAALRNLPAAPMVFVAHSGAGALTPAVLEAHDGCAIFLDALLPHPGKSWFDTAPPALKQRLQDTAKDGRLPPWPRWWPKGAIEALIGDAAMAETFISACPDLPLAYFSEIAPATAPLRADRCAYVQLSEGYTSEVDIAAAQGWRTERMPLHHLAMLTHPDDVAAVIDKIACAFEDVRESEA